VSHAFFHPDPASTPPGESAGGSTGELTEHLVADQACTGPWSARTMHGGPPAALLVRACERAIAAVANGGSGTSGSGDAGAGLTALRASIDFIAPVPVGEVTVRSRVLRGGRRISLAEAVLVAGHREVLHARTWLLRTEAARYDGDQEGDQVAGAPAEQRGAPRPGPQECPLALTQWAFPYARATEWRRVSGDPDGPGDAAAWARPRIPLVVGESPTGLQRAVLVADSGNGISAALDWDRWSFVNVDLVVHLSRPLAGDWVLLDARTRYEPGGTGLATSVLSDEAGVVGTGAQTLLVSPR
jgi:acyl-coenzyme A thioesterase PaaI-like protein